MSQQLARIHAAFELRQWEIAQQSLDQALSETPGDSDFLALQAELFLRTENYSGAARSARDTIAAAPEWSLGYLWLAWSLMADADAPGERQHDFMVAARQAVHCNPADASNYHLLAEACRLTGNLSEAQEKARQGIELSVEHRGCWESLAQTQLALGLFHEAEASLRILLQRDPESSLAHMLLANCLLRLSRHVEAFEHARTAVRVDPNDPQVRSVYSEVVRHQHPLARRLLRGAEFANRFVYLFVAIGFAPLFVLSSLGRKGALDAALGLIWLLVWGFFAVFALGLVEVVIVHSTRWGKLLPETWGAKPLVLFGVMTVLLLPTALIWSAAIMSPYPILFAGNFVVIGAVALMARAAEDVRTRRLRMLGAILPIGIVVLACIWRVPADMAGSLPTIILAAWALSFAIPLATTKYGSG